MLRAAVILGLLTAALGAPAASAAVGDVERVSVASDGAQGDDDSTAPSISGDGNVVAFQSRAGNLVGGDANGGLDVFTRRRAARETDRVNGGGSPPVSAGSSAPAVSADGISIAFESFSPELGAGPVGDVFVRRGGGAIVRVTAPTGNGGNGGGFTPAISGDGGTVVFASSSPELVVGDENGLPDVFSFRAGSIQRLSRSFGGAEANGSSDQPAIARDGGIVAFRSEATNLVGGSDPGGTADIYVRTSAGSTERVSLAVRGGVPNGDSEDPSISANGKVVAFVSSASDLVPGDGNGFQDVFVHDRDTRVTTRVNVASDGTEANLGASGPSISADGRFVAFASRATNLDAGDTNNVGDIFVHDRQTGVTSRVSKRRGFPGGEGSGDDSVAPAISADGCFVAFETGSFGGFSSQDTNGAADVHVADLGCGGSGSGGGAGAGSGNPVDPIGPQPPATDPISVPRDRDPVASPVRGRVRVRSPGRRRFTALRGPREIIDGSEIDTRRGVLRLVVGSSTALVSKGRAVVRGTTLKLTGRTLIVRALEGRFRTRTQRSATSGQRSTWRTTDRRRATVVAVLRGTATVRDLAKRRSVRLDRGERYRVRSSQPRTAPQ